MNTTFSFNRLPAAHDIQQTTCSIQLGEAAPVTPPAVSCEIQHTAYNIQHTTYDYDVSIQAIPWGLRPPRPPQLSKVEAVVDEDIQYIAYNMLHTTYSKQHATYSLEKLHL